MRTVQRQVEHERRDDVRQARIASSRQDRSRGVSDGGSVGDSESSNAGSDSDGSSDDDDDSDSSTSNDTTVCTGEKQEGATTDDYMADACRLFPWKDDQKTLAKELWSLMQTPHSDHSARTDTLLRLIKSFVFVTSRGDAFSRGLLQFLAVLSIDEEMGRRREANDFSYMLAGVVYCTRIFAVEAILPSTERDCQGEDDDRRFLETRERYLADGGYSPMSKTLSLLAYGNSSLEIMAIRAQFSGMAATKPCHFMAARYPLLGSNQW